MSRSSPQRDATALFLAGPTASGKSGVALALAMRLGGEIISVDSMQVYRGLDIGTAKPSATERRAVPHHLIDVVDLTAPFDAVQFVALARTAEADIRRRGRRPVFCGGTGLYFKAYLEGLGAGPASCPALREELERTPLADLLAELARGDPATYAAIDRRNPRRVVRAVEVLRLTGRPVGALRAAWSGPAPGNAAHPPCFGLRRSSEDLRRRIEARVEAMFAAGLVAETAALRERGLEGNRTALQAIGYRQVVEHLRGERSLAETVALVKARTWQFARRQMTWFRHQMAVEWIDVGTDDSADVVAERILERLNR
ncbi:MAG TPA: tRNA (adenosine(37)-N6)-dimethylallyltransferase MiaA [Methylomirabilota bacterium]|nr:tRNA (adenosine(37)-N6)-dimethylallyltransferase MiaA [Methylomirabilota bacterium]